jgi:poly(hydroxyalkanoate) depolymerase family esterase
MNDGYYAGMLEATRLTRAGRLAEATEMLRFLLQGRPAPTTTSHAEAHAGGPVLDLEAERVEEGTNPTAAPGAPTRAQERVDRQAKGDAPDDKATWKSRDAWRSHAPSARFINCSYQNQFGRRVYKLYVPSGYCGRPLPLVVMLHGCTQSPDDFAVGTQMNTRAEEEGCFVAYPAQPRSANASKCWNWFRHGDQRHGRGEPSLIAGITRNVMRNYKIDSRRIFIAGLSAGGAAAAIMGAAYPDLYAAVGVHSGLACGCASDMPSAFAAMREGGSGCLSTPGARAVPTIVFHGDCDQTVNARNGDHVIAQVAAAMGDNLEKRMEQGQVAGGHSYRRTLYAEPQGPVLLEHWLIHGAGHAWAGGSARGSFTDPRGPDATREMLRFFGQHPHPQVPDRESLR